MSDIFVLKLQTEGDIIKIDINKRTLDLMVDGETLSKRRAKLKPYTIKYKGLLGKYARTVSDASHGAIV